MECVGARKERDWKGEKDHVDIDRHGRLAIVGL
jgi:hypothetical protein